MPHNRRTFIKASLLGSAYFSLRHSGLLQAAENAALPPSDTVVPGTLADAMKAFHNATDIKLHDDIILKLPRVVENGAVVPVSVNTTLPDVTDITLWVAKNASPLAATFKLSPLMLASVSARIKIAETCNVIAVVNSAGTLYKARQEVSVTIGGCGG